MPCFISSKLKLGVKRMKMICFYSQMEKSKHLRLTRNNILLQHLSSFDFSPNYKK